MTRKQLPRAITRRMENLREIAADSEAAQAPPRRVAIFDVVEAEPAPEIVPKSDEAVSLQPNLIGPEAAAPTRPDPLAATRRELARKIVERHKIYAAMGGLLPLPIVNIAGVTAINVRMVKALSDLYQVPFQRDRARAMIVGLIGGTVPTGLGTATASTLLFVVPGSALVGLGVSALSAAAVTRGIGLVFLEHFEAGAG